MAKCRRRLPTSNGLHANETQLNPDIQSFHSWRAGVVSCGCPATFQCPGMVLHKVHKVDFVQTLCTR